MEQVQENMSRNIQIEKMLQKQQKTIKIHSKKLKTKR